MIHLGITADLVSAASERVNFGYTFESIVFAPRSVPAPRTQPGTKRPVNILAVRCMKETHRFIINTQALLTVPKQSSPSQKLSKEFAHVF